MRRRVDPARQSRDDGKAGVAQALHQHLRDLDPGRGRIARANNGDLRRGQRGGMAADRQQRRRIVDHRQPLRIIRLAHGNDRDAEFFRRRDLALGLGARTDFRREIAWCICATAAGERRQRFQRRARPAEMIDQRPERARPDILAADQPQPIDPLLVGQPEGFCCGVVHAPNSLPGER